MTLAASERRSDGQSDRSVRTCRNSPKFAEGFAGKESRRIISAHEVDVAVRLRVGRLGVDAVVLGKLVDELAVQLRHHGERGLE